MVCEGCGRRTIPDLSGLCAACQADEWRELSRRANVWDVDTLHATTDERPVPKPRPRKSRAAMA